MLRTAPDTRFKDQHIDELRLYDVDKIMIRVHDIY